MGQAMEVGPCSFVVNMDSADMISQIIEPLFQKFRARVEMHPIMVLDDLKKAFS